MFAFFVLWYFVLVFTLISITSLVQKSPTADEPIHLFSGYSYLKWHDFRANAEHPPLIKMWAALPLLAFDVKDPRPSRPTHWELIHEDLYGHPGMGLINDMLFLENDGEAFFFFAKLQMIVIGIVLGVFVFLWSRALFGGTAAIAALLIYALDPNVLAHSQIVHTDIPFAAWLFAGSYFFWRALTRPSRWAAALTSFFFGLAAITKYSAIVILPIWAITAILGILLGRNETGPSPVNPASSGKKMFRLGGLLAAAAATAYLFMWMIYGFRFDAIPGGAHPLDLERVAPAAPLAGRIVDFAAAHHLVPEAWLYGQLYVVKFLKRTTFLFGASSDEGFLSYFPAAFAVKTPLPTLMLFLAALWMLIRGRINRAHAVFLLAPALLYFALAVWSRANLGLRYILPVYPFLFVLAGAAAAALWHERGRKRAAVALLLGWLLASCASTYPHYLAYFNELVGGPKNGYKALLDSNLDWGQDLKGLKRWMDDHGVKKIGFLYFGWTEPEYYGIDAAYLKGSWIKYDPPATQTTEPYRYVAMSAHLFHGLAKDEPFLKPFRSQEPAAVIGHSIFIFKLQENRSG